jgi:RHS repeat-associated protein
MCSAASGTCRDGYDALNRLITVIAPARWGTGFYDYDALGNRALKSLDQPASVTQTYAYDSSNRLASTSGPETFRPMTFTWDAAGRLASSSDGTTYAYDANGRRVMKAEATGTTVYHYDAQGRVIAESTPSGARLRDYVYLAGKLLAVEGCVTDGTTPPCSERQYYHTDALGSVLARTLPSGTVTARVEYQPWGEQWQPTGSLGVRQYNGRVYDPGTGFHDYGARMYWPQIGRFVSADSFEGELDDPQSLNRYAYVTNNPYRYTDPTGHQKQDETKLQNLGVMGAGGLVPPSSIAKTSGSGPNAGAGAARGPVSAQGSAQAAKAPAAQPAAPASQSAASTPTSTAAAGTGQAAGRGSAARGAQPPQHGTFYVDPKGNVIPTPPGGRITSSPDGRFVQARDAAGRPTGVRIDGGHKPASHPDPRAQAPHGHVPGVTNPDGTPWLPIR